MKYIFLDYDRSSTRKYHITSIMDELIKNDGENYSFTTFDEISENSSSADKLTQFFIAKYGSVPKYIISYGSIGSFNGIHNTIIKVSKLVFIVDDIHHQGSAKRSRIPVLKSSSFVFSTYAYLYTKFGLPKPAKLYLFPHSAKFTCVYNNNPISKILISGRVADAYPDRLFAKKIALKDKERFDVLECNFSYSESETNKQNLICGEKFYEYLNKYLCCFVDTARNYLMAKTFEICASGSLLLCMNVETIDIMRSIGFIDGVNYISCSRDNFHEKVNFILDVGNRRTIDQIRENGYELIKSKHMWTNRMDFFKRILESDDVTDVTDVEKDYGEYVY